MVVRIASSSSLLLIHWGAMIALTLSFLTGLRLFISNTWQGALTTWWAPMLPKGDIFALHVSMGWLWLVVLIIWVARRGERMGTRRLSKTTALDTLNHITLRSGRLILPVLLLTGLLLWSGSPFLRSVMITLHAALAFATLACVMLHIIGQFIVSSWPGVKTVLIGLPAPKLILAASFAVPVIIVAVIWALRDTINPVTVTTLAVKEIPREQRITLDGVLDETFWQTSTAVTVSTRVPGTSEHIPVEVRAARQGAVIYFAFSWPDPTQSTAHLPLIKTEQGWRVMHEGYADNDERQWYEDKFAVIFSDQPAIAGNGATHLGVGKSDGVSKESLRGAHYTQSGLVDLWHWKAVRNHGYGVLDDSHIATPYPRIPGEQRYAAGYQADPSLSSSYSNNFLWFNEDQVRPKRLPVNPDQLAPFQVQRDDAEAIPFGLSWYETEPYDPGNDPYPVGTIMPSVLWTTIPELDRADVAAQGHWRAGRWTLEAARGIQAESGFDLDITDGTYLWVATFDHAQTQHSYHLRPLRLRFE